MPMPRTITKAQPAASAKRNQAGGFVSCGQSSQHSATAVHSKKLSRIMGRSLPASASGSASPTWRERQMLAATAAAMTPLMT